MRLTEFEQRRRRRLALAGLVDARLHAARDEADSPDESIGRGHVTLISDYIGRQTRPEFEDDEPTAS